MIQVTGLTDAQVKLLNILWNMDSMEDVERFINTFGPKRQKECWTLIELAKLAALDEIEEIATEIPIIIDSIKNLDS